MAEAFERLVSKGASVRAWCPLVRTVLSSNVLLQGGGEALLVNSAVVMMNIHVQISRV